ncbi:MAG: hypothetical protein IPP73_12030 [Chitinophagaceae bacterium]|nr:hypothetical protein [Chitinophagaceae bacterium]
MRRKNVLLLTLIFALIAASAAVLRSPRKITPVKEDIPSCCTQTACPEKKNAPAKLIMDNFSHQFISVPVLIR